MPKVHEVKSLVKLCTGCIKKTIDKGKFTSDSKAARMEDKSQTTSNPFHQLPSSLLEEVIQSFTGSRIPTDAKILDHLIAPIHLQHLSFVYHFSAYSIFHPKLRKLLILDLKNTGIGDSCLKSIGIYCSELRSLNLKNCVHVSDIGIQWLCGGDGLGNGKSGLCWTLQKLDILYTSVRERGIQTALKNLLSLTIINHFEICDALLKIAKSAIKSKRDEIDKFRISILYTPRFQPNVKGCLQLVLPLCKLVNRVKIFVIDSLKDSDILCLMSIKMLRRLEIVDSSLHPNKIKITFEGGIFPLLQAFGKTLESLSLDCIVSVRISTIVELCPNLTYLRINNTLGLLENEENLFQMENNQLIFKELTHLYCVSNIPYNVLIFLLSSPSLEDIGVSHCDTLTDEVLHRATDYHQFQKLEKLELEKCNSVSELGINALLVENNPLKKLYLKFCANLCRENFSFWSMQINRKNWDLELLHYF